MALDDPPIIPDDLHFFRYIAMRAPRGRPGGRVLTPRGRGALDGYTKALRALLGDL